MTGQGRNLKVGDPADPHMVVGPMVSRKQYNVQDYIRIGLDEGAEILVGREGHPDDLEAGNFVKPTVFINVTNNMLIAREEIFGPLLSIITYKPKNKPLKLSMTPTMDCSSTSVQQTKPKPGT